MVGDGARRKISGGTWEARRGGFALRDQRLAGINNRRVGPGRESDRFIVAGKRVMTVERRGRDADVLG